MQCVVRSVCIYINAVCVHNLHTHLSPHGLCGSFAEGQKIESDFRKCSHFLVTCLNNTVKRGSFPYRELLPHTHTRTHVLVQWKVWPSLSHRSRQIRRYSTDSFSHTHRHSLLLMSLCSHLLITIIHIIIIQISSAHDQNDNVALRRASI